MVGSRNFDVVIAGAGPAGLSLAHEIGRLGARVAVVDPDPERPWRPTYCAFARDLPPDVPVARRWDTAVVHLDSRRIAIDEPYLQVDGDTLRARLLETSGVVPVAGCVATVSDDAVVLSDGSQLVSPYTVDCTGIAQALGGDGRPSAFQTAYGVEIETRGHPWPVDEAVWMDLRGFTTPPTFLYVLPLSKTRVFVEETALAARPPVPMSVLAERLEARLEGIDVVETFHVERCTIPLDIGQPRGLAFGTAAGMVHPSTGYLLSRVLEHARSFAEAILDGRGLQAMERLVPPTPTRLHRLGLEVLVRSDGPALTEFFENFFAQPPAARDAFLDRDPQLAPTVWAMSRTFLTAPWTLKRRLAEPLFTARPEE